MARVPQAATDRRGRTRIGTRLGMLLVVPLLGLVAMTAIQVTTAVRQYREATELSGRADVAVAAGRLVDALQAERTALASDQAVTPAMRSRVERAAAELRGLRDQTEGQDRDLLDRALERADAAGSLARTATGGVVAVDGDSPAIDALLRLSDRSLDPGAVLDNGPATTAGLLAAAQEAASRERGLLTALADGRTLGPAQFRQATELSAAQQILASRAALGAAPALRVTIDRLVDDLRAADDSRESLFFDDPAPADIAAWLRAADGRVERFGELRSAATASAAAAIDALAASSARVLVASGLALVATVLVSVLLVRGATRSIARPLADLAARAEDVALSRLPEAVRAQQQGDADVRLPRVRAGGAAEVREVAAAFNDVQDTALRLASEQAVLRRNQTDALTNLGRRNQTLLGRQLDFISDLEKRETDPAFLEHLFRLDHLASRMRRNAESLLILAGSETPRRRRNPAEISEIVRAAMSEVEDFERVRLGHLGDATVSGPVVIDLVHLVAELVENALNFSPPATTVEIDGRSLGQGGYQLAVIDHGVGMTDVELQAANQRMGGGDDTGGMPTRYLGQYVIARLAAKTGTLVRLQPTAGGRGVTAVVTVPASAMVGGPDRSSVAMPLPGTRASRELGPEPFAPGAGLVAAQPDEVVDPHADPYADPAPMLDEPLVEPFVMVPPPPPAGAPLQEWSPSSSTDPVPPVSTVPPAPVGTITTAPDGGAGAGPPAPGEVPVPHPAGGPSPAFPSPAPVTAAGSVAEELLAPFASGPAPDGEPGASTPVWNNGPTALPHHGSTPEVSRLTRRIPGASLARSPLSQSEQALDAQERSADGVRSMLAAFQSGRARGRDDGRSEPQPGREAPGREEAP